ncbi:hypothetical protein GGX14DRAFT_361340, partial [Mycena pura]
MVQGFPVSQRDPPALHRTLVKCLNKYGLTFATVNPSTALLQQMPLWHHPGEDSTKRQENNGRAARCMRANHAALTIGDGLDIALRMRDPLHSNQATCACDRCEADRTSHGCSDPHACVTKAASRLKQIHPRWIPKPDHGDDESVPIAPDGSGE